MIQIQLNGVPRTLPFEEGTVDQLIEALQLRRDRIAIELNGEIVPRKMWHETIVHDEAKVEIVHFVGGGRPLETVVYPQSF